MQQEETDKIRKPEKLVVSYKELAFQNEEKEKRTAELIVANQQLNKANEALQNRLNEVSDYKYALEESSILAITDQKGIIKYVNDKFCIISKYSAEELIGQDHRIVNSAYHPKSFIKNLWGTIANGKIWKGELCNIAKDGSIYWVDTVIIPFLNKEGKPYQYLAIRTDITNRKKVREQITLKNKELEIRTAELTIANKELAFQNDEKEKRAAELVMANEGLNKAEVVIKKLNMGLEQKVMERTAELESANKELESFSYSVSHDLRAPLRAVNGYAQILKEDYGTQLEPEASRLTNNIMTNAKKMGQLIDDLLTFSRLGRIELVKMNIVMHDMVSNLCDNIKDQENNSNIQFHINELQPAKGNIIAIEQVWVNLISNAVKYSSGKERPIIEIGSEIKGDEIIYHVKDNGAGFDMRYADKLFGIFQRLHSDEKFEGTGVGLALVKRLIARHGGRVWAEGKVNEGATFYFTLHK